MDKYDEVMEGAYVKHHGDEIPPKQQMSVSEQEEFRRGFDIGWTRAKAEARKYLTALPVEQEPDFYLVSCMAGVFKKFYNKNEAQEHADVLNKAFSGDTIKIKVEPCYRSPVIADKDAEIERLNKYVDELRAMNKSKEARILILTNSIFKLPNESGLSFDEAINELNRQEEEAGYYKDQEAKIIADQEQTIQTLREAKDNAYTERNKLVAFLSHIYPAHIKLHPASDTSWDDDWRTIICIHSPMGQLTWHIHDSEAGMFGHLNVKPDPFADCEWDGHTTDEKYKRLLNVSALNGKEGEDGASL